MDAEIWQGVEARQASAAGDDVAVVQCASVVPKVDGASSVAEIQSQNHTGNENKSEEVYEGAVGDPNTVQAAGDSAVVAETDAPTVAGGDTAVVEAAPAAGTLDGSGSGAAVGQVAGDPAAGTSAGEAEASTEGVAAAPRKKGRGPDLKQRRLRGTGGLQQEKTGMYTVRCIINGKRIAKSTGTKDREEAERFLKKFLAPYVKGDPELTYLKVKEAVATEKQLAEMREDELPQLSLDGVWEAYDKSLMRRDLADTTLEGKRQVWKKFRKFMNDVFPEVTELRRVERKHAEAYLNTLRDGHSALTYNQRLCVLREMHRVLMEVARAKSNPWEGFQLRPDDSHTRRELTVEELARLIDVASRQGFEWRCLFAIGMYTGMRLGDCCKLTWGEVDIVRSIIQKIPEKTKKYRKGRPITVPIHKVLSDLLMQTPVEERTGYVLPEIGQWANGGTSGMGKIHHRLHKIFRNAGIVTSVTVEGRKWKAPEAGFHSLRHTFVSLSANAGVPLHIVQSIVGHESNAMTRHYFHENVVALQKAVEAIPSISETGEVRQGEVAQPDAARMYNRLGQQTQPYALPQPPPMTLPPPLAVPQAAVSAPTDGEGRVSTGADAPLVGRSAARNAVRRDEKLAVVEAANRAAADMGGWGLEGSAAASQLPTINKRQRQEWISRCVRKWCIRNKMAILEGTTMLLGNGGYRFLQEVWGKGTPMMPEDAIDAMEVFLRAKGAK